MLRQSASGASGVAIAARRASSRNRRIERKGRVVTSAPPLVPPCFDAIGRPAAGCRRDGQISFQERQDRREQVGVAEIHFEQIAKRGSPRQMPSSGSRIFSISHGTTDAIAKRPIDAVAATRSMGCPRRDCSQALRGLRRRRQQAHFDCRPHLVCLRQRDLVDHRVRGPRLAKQASSEGRPPRRSFAVSPSRPARTAGSRSRRLSAPASRTARQRTSRRNGRQIIQALSRIDAMMP